MKIKNPTDVAMGFVGPVSVAPPGNGSGAERSGALTPSPSPTGEGSIYTAVWKITPSAFSVY